MSVNSNARMKKQNEAKTMRSMQEELRFLLTSADNLLRLFNTYAALTVTDGANRNDFGSRGDQGGILR